MKILNLYAGIGGNRKFWAGHDVTAVEHNHNTAEVYRSFYPEDTVVEGDAHQYLLDHHHDYDFIWSSPPCPTHSQLNYVLHAQGHVRYPDMSLYQEIIFLRQWGRHLKWAVENVVPYYVPLIRPDARIERHLLWSNFDIDPLELESVGRIIGGKKFIDPPELEEKLGIKLPQDTKGDKMAKRRMLRDITRPEIGEHVLKCAERELVYG